MKRAHLAIAIVGVSVMLAAEPICRRSVVPVVLRHHSAATLAKWKTWREAHPGWVQPKKAETLAKYDLACAEIRTVDADAAGFVLPVDAPVWVEPDLLSAAPPLVGLQLPEYQPEFSKVRDGWDVLHVLTPLPFIPYFPDRYPPPSAPVPEPASAWLLLTGIVGMVCVAVRGGDGL